MMLTRIAAPIATLRVVLRVVLCVVLRVILRRRRLATSFAPSKVQRNFSVRVSFQPPCFRVQHTSKTNRCKHTIEFGLRELSVASSDLLVGHDHVDSDVVGVCGNGFDHLFFQRQRAGRTHEFRVG